MALQVKIRRITFRMLMRTKQKIPKLCMGARVCHTELLGSTAVQTGSSVRAKITSTINNRITAPEIYLDA